MCQDGAGEPIVEPLAAAKAAWPASGRPSLAIVVPVRNEILRVAGVLRQLEDQTTRPNEVFFIDGSSDDGPASGSRTLVAIDRGCMWSTTRPRSSLSASTSGSPNHGRIWSLGWTLMSTTRRTISRYW